MSSHVHTKNRDYNCKPCSVRRPTQQYQLLQYITHVRVYAELLYRAGLLTARAEVLHLLPTTENCPAEDDLNELDKQHLSKPQVISIELRID